jgi:cobalt-zinc-cadmium efflux system membrane fusion protein
MKKTILLYIILSLFIFTSCNRNDEGTEEEKLEPVAYTLYAKHSELFVEFKPLVVGETSRFAAHVTVLGDLFTPLTGGKVSVNVANNGSAVANSPSSPGIFRPEIIPTNAGNNLQVTFIIDARDFTDTITINDVTVYPDLQTALNSQGHQHEEHIHKDGEETEHDHSENEVKGDEITFSKEQAWKVEFANEEVKKQTFYYTIKTTGQILTPPSEEAIISAKSGGIVNYNGNYIAGMRVVKGENLFNVSGSNLNEGNINTRIFEAKSNYEKSKADYERASELVKDKIISDKEFLAIKNTYEIASDVYNSLTVNYGESGVRVYTPISGYLRTLEVRQGEYVQPGQTLATVTQNLKLILKADLSQKYIDIINEIRSANFKTPDGRAFDTESLNGKSIVYGRNTGQDNLLLPVNFEIDYREDLIPGTFVEVFLKTNRLPDALVIPVSALIEEQGVFYAYVQTGGESFEKRELTLGESDGSFVQILKGIEEGERVVTKGAYQIKLASLSGTLPAHGHEH